MPGAPFNQQLQDERDNIKELLLGLGVHKKKRDIEQSQNPNVQHLQKNQETDPNLLMMLGYRGDLVHRGKGLIPGVKALQQADYKDYWPIDNGIRKEST